MTTTAAQSGVPRDAWERTVDEIIQILRKYSLQHDKSLHDLFPLLVNDLHQLTGPGLPSSPPSTTSPSAPRRRRSLALRHVCKNQSTCQSYCGLCARNPNKRCEADGDWAPKHVEHAKLETCCHATLLATLSCPEPLPGDQPDVAAPFEAQQFYIECSLVSAQERERWLEDQGPGAVETVNTLRRFEKLLTTPTKDKPAEQLLRKGVNNPETSDNLRVRADFLEGADCVSIDVRVLENSDKRLFSNNKYQLLVVLVQRGDGQPVGYALSNKFQVTTSRSQRSWNIDIPCWDTDVQRLKGCGEETRKKLQDIRKWALKEHNFVPPVGGINQVVTVEEWRQLNQEMKSWGPVPRQVRAALTPEKAVEHAEKMLPRDFRMRIFWPQDSQIGAMYLCKQGHVDLANYSSGILLAYNMVDGIRMTWPEGRDAEQSQTMALVARQAELAWRSLDGQMRHPGWFAVKEGTAGEPPLNLDYFGRMEPNVNGSLDFNAHELAVFLGLPPSIFERSARAPQPGGVLLSQLQGQQPPQPHPYPHPSQGAAPGSRAADAHMPTDGTTPFGSAQTWQLSPSSAAMPETDSDACGLSPLFQYESPRNSGDMLNQQSSEYDPVCPAPPTMPSFHEQNAGSHNMLLASLPLPHLNNQGILDFNGSITSCEVPGCLSPILAPPGSAQPGLMSPVSGQGLARYGFGQHSNHPAGMLQPQQSPASPMRQDIQDQEHAALAVPAPWVTNERLSQSQIERVRSRELAPTNSFTEREPKRRHTAPAETLEQALQSIYSQYSSGTSLLQGDGRQPTQPHSGTLVAAPTGSIASEPSHHWTVPELSLPITVERPLSQPTWLQIEYQHCAYNPSSDDSSIRDQLNENDPMSLVARSDGLGDAANSQQLVADQDQVEVIQRHVQPAVYLFLAKMRALVVRRRQHQHGAVAHSPALESSNRMWQLAVLARFANISRVDLWGDVVTRHEGDGLLIPNISAQDLGQNLGQLYQHWCVE